MEAEYKRADSVVSSGDPEGRGVLLSVEDGVYYTLNASAWEVWGDLTEPTSVTELAPTFASRHGITTEQARQDLASLLADLEQRRLLVRFDR